MVQLTCSNENSAVLSPTRARELCLTVSIGAVSSKPENLRGNFKLNCKPRSVKKGRNKGAHQ